MVPRDAMKELSEREVPGEVAHAALRVLADASAALLVVSDVATTLDQILKFARELVAADGYAVWRSYDGGLHWRMLASSGLSTSNWGEFRVEDPARIAEVLVVDDVLSDPDFGQRREFYKAEGICSLLCVAVAIEDRPGATITFYYRRPHVFSESEFQYAKALGNLAGAALYTSELQDAQQRERRRLNFLAEASALLGSSLQYEETLRTIARLAVPHLADGCTVSMYEEDKLIALAVAHVDPEKEKTAADFSRRFLQKLTDGCGTAAVLATGKPSLLPYVSDEYLVSTAESEEYLAASRALGLHSLLLLPLKSRDRVIGVMRLFTDLSQRRLDEDDLYFAEDLSARASTAIENAQLFRELGLSEARYRSLVEATASLAFTADPEGNFAEPQPAWSAYCGQTWEEARGYGWAMALHPEDRQRLIEGVREAVLDTGGPHQNRGRVWHAASGSYRHCTVRAVPMKDSEGRVREWVGIIVDVHDQVLAEEKLRRTEQLATAGRLAATVAHEINNPLESITNLIYLAQQASNMDEEVRGYLQIASQEMQRVAHIVRQTLGFYRENAAPRVADIGEIAAGVLELYQRNFQAKGLKTIAEIESGVKACVVPGEIRQVIANLVANAIDASDSGSEIRVTVAGNGEGVAIRIADRGTGIADEHMAHLFEPFFTTKRDVGTGLGLWVSRDLVEKHHGTLMLETKTGPEDHGTVFTVVLPAGGSPETAS